MTFDWWTFALQAVNFLILAWLLQRFLYKPVAGIIEKRREQAEEAARAADKAKADAEAVKADYQKKIGELEQERQHVLDEAHEQIAKERQAALDAARAEADKMAAEAREAMEKEQASTLKALKGEIAEMASDMARKVLADAAPNIPDADFLQAVLSRIEALPQRERDRLHASLAADGAAITITTAHRLGKTDQTKWRDAIGKALGQEIDAKFRADASLIGGAELEFPDAVLRLSWNDEVKQVKQMLVGDGESS